MSTGLGSLRMHKTNETGSVSITAHLKKPYNPKQLYAVPHLRNRITSQSPSSMRGSGFQMQMAKVHQPSESSG